MDGYDIDELEPLEPWEVYEVLHSAIVAARSYVVRRNPRAVAVTVADIFARLSEM